MVLRPSALVFLSTVRTEGRWHSLMPALLVILLATLSVKPAQAEIRGYVSSGGSGRVSSPQPDEHYERAYRSNVFGVDESKMPISTEMDVPQDIKIVKLKPRRSLTYLEISSDYKAIQHLIREASTTHGIDYELLQALIATESGFNARAVSPKGAIGLMQLIPPTAARYGVKDDKESLAQEKLTDPRTNIHAGSSYLNYLIKLFPGELELAIAAYNAGEGAVKRAGNKIPNYPETQNYVKTVMQLYQRLKPQSFGGGTVAVNTTNRLDGSPTGRVRVEMRGSNNSNSNSGTASSFSRAAP